MSHTISTATGLDIEFDYQPAEPAERGPEAQYPGCPEEIELLGVWVFHTNVLEALNDESIVDIIDLIHAHREAESDVPY